MKKRVLCIFSLLHFFRLISTANVLHRKNIYFRVMKLHPTRLEDLPNEILLHIIECSGSPADIYRSFHGLNRRFYHLIHRVQLSLDVYCEDKEYSFLTEYFSWNFQRLCIFSLCPSIRLDRFVHLRSLTITEPTDNQIHSIQSRTLPELEYLCSPASMVRWIQTATDLHLVFSLILEYFRLFIWCHTGSMDQSSFLPFPFLSCSTGQVDMEHQFSPSNTFWCDLFTFDSE